MRAHLGDQLVIKSQRAGEPGRDGEIIGLRHDDGTPPYDVRWSDTGDVTLVFPGPDAHVHHLEHHPQHARTEPGRPDASGVPVPVPTPTATVPVGVGPGDIGRRVAAERRRRRLTREETARRARVSPEYLRYIEEHPAAPTPATLIRLSDALGTTVAALRGGGADAPPAQGRALRHPRLRDLDPKECRALLAGHGVGRVAVTTPEGSPAVYPVNYDLLEDTIVFRTTPGSAPAKAVGTDVAFEVDHVDAALSQGWSVLAVGPAAAVTDPETVRDLSRRVHTTPWAGGERDLWVSIRPTRLTGRRITQADDR
ncbi:pyridoxamine 5'-phosphate oxidase family protein [Streptomyces alkaliterrae]|uniref:DUF1918 domain-containing protein n=1 Tax=Streptomyces alkaliterrae TaxID=2213162 RepID=A0A5P0YX85_9ACTN|nr:pyridoxamine 5'-phosphate oxidase family protein [Streptomyces alkaliterrae]MBB1262117.1 DUF1918 domain-containing protein [Streptomyces alkaliterrae]MQS04896.1 DUF1918 domain-containing protein [Streptomyces alkaliterrae]